MPILVWVIVILIVVSVITTIISSPFLYKRWRRNYIANEAQQFLRDLNRKHL